VAIATARRVTEARQQQGFAVLTGQVAVDQFNRLVVASSAVLDLVDRRYRGLEVSDFMNIVGLAVAVIATGLIAVHAAANRAACRAMALAAALFIRQRLEVSILVLRCNIRVTFMTGHIGMSGGSKGNILVAFSTINFLSTGCECRQNQQCRGREMGAGETN
jgi:hypothetical protein